ncbi:hypothetical protein CVT25_001029 [Psilocybe cyanescens]|uniref:Secreted protein n=1 Tax=Psilocybe cyanescens TaxID=93625 RepID=A0A409X8V4_PSICY|nr:hypothetical protein CVT25_001029 [Psilocybe cyanescens]
MWCLLLMRSCTCKQSVLAKLSVVFFDDVNFTRATYSSSKISPGVCRTLPGDWLSRPESILIGTGFTCTFTFTRCKGPGHQLSRRVNSLPTNTNLPLYNNIKSFSCNKQI